MMMIPVEHGLAGHFWLFQENRESTTSKGGWLVANPGSRRGSHDLLRDGLPVRVALPRAQDHQAYVAVPRRKRPIAFDVDA